MRRSGWRGSTRAPCAGCRNDYGSAAQPSHAERFPVHPSGTALSGTAGGAITGRNGPERITEERRRRAPQSGARRGPRPSGHRPVGTRARAPAGDRAVTTRQRRTRAVARRTAQRSVSARAVMCQAARPYQRGSIKGKRLGAPSQKFAKREPRRSRAVKAMRRRTRRPRGRARAKPRATAPRAEACRPLEDACTGVPPLGSLRSPVPAQVRARGLRPLRAAGGD